MNFIRSRRSLLAFLLALSLPFVLAACGSDEGGDDAGDTQAQETPAGDETTPAESGEAQFLHVVAEEYKFVGLPESLDAGSYQFHLQNDGKEPHELVLFQIKTDTPVDELIRLPQKEAEEQIQIMGATFAQPGQVAEQTLDVELEPGRYAAVCFVSDGKKDPPHAFQGMVHEFTVQ